VTDQRVPAPHTHHLRVQRTARYYTLGGESPERRAIWFVLHGYSQLAGEFVRYFVDLAAPDSLIVAPEALNRFYTVAVEKIPARDRPVGATWMTREDRAYDIADYVEYLDVLYDDVVGQNASGDVAINVIGFSQGAATATRWVTHTNRRIDRLILWGGLLPPETELTPGNALRRSRLTIVVGTRDQYVNAAALDGERARLDTAGLPYDVIQFEGGHAINRAVFPQLLDLIGASGR
jgi:predicted esterase